jgi:hypothetical protein
MANDSVGTRAQSAGLVIIDTFQCQISFSSKERHNLSGSKFFEINVRGHIPRLQPNGVSRSRGFAYARKPAARRAFGHSGFAISGRRWGAPRTLPDGFGHCPTATSQRCRRAGIFGGDSRSPRHGGSAAARLCAACRDRSSRCRTCPPRTSRRILERLEALKRPAGHDHQAKQRKGATNRCSASPAIVWPMSVTVPCAARPAGPLPLARHPEIQTFSIAPVGRNVVCHAGKHAIARRWAANRRSADRRNGGALVARPRRRSGLCPHTVIIPRIGTNTCGWPAALPKTGGSHPNARPRASRRRPRFVRSNAALTAV